MLVAIIAAVLAAIAVLVLAGVAFAFYRNKHTPKVSKHRVRTLETVGVESSVKPRAGTEQRVQQDATEQATPHGPLDMRFKVMGGFAAVVFAALGLKVASMQLLNSRSYSEKSADNQYSTVYTPAPRGIIYDCKGRELVRNRSSLTVLASPDVADDRDTLARLSAVLGIPYAIVKQRIQDATTAAVDSRVVESDVEINRVAFISEHADAFPGVTVESRTVREYPYGALGAHFLGYTGTVSQEELAELEEGRNVKMGDDVGKAGVEARYDKVLAGTHGERKVMTDANSNIIEVVGEIDPTRGDDVVLCIDARVQYAADRLLAETIAPNGAIGSGKGTGGAVVVMDARDGGIVAMASYPTFLPKEFIGGIADNVWEVYNSDTALNPMLNRAIAGTYPAASTYKSFTALAGLKYGFADREGETTYVCTGRWDGFGTGDVQKCWLDYGHGELDLFEGIVESCDVVFYEIAKNFFDESGKIGDEALQAEIRKYNLGEQMGIDLEGEAYGRVPTPQWKREYFKDVPEEASWRGGDTTNMIIGQGYVLVTPLQIACAYAGVATGKIMRPHLLKEVLNAEGSTSVRFEPAVVCEPDVVKEDLDFVREALHNVSTNGGSVAGDFEGAGLDAAAKTGTGEVAGKADFSWTVAYAPFDDPHYVAAVIVEEGGGGSETAAPICAEILAAALQAEAGEELDIAYVAGSTGRVIEGGGKLKEGRTD